MFIEWKFWFLSKKIKKEMVTKMVFRGGGLLVLGDEAEEIVISMLYLLLYFVKYLKEMAQTPSP